MRTYGHWREWRGDKRKTEKNLRGLRMRALLLLIVAQTAHGFGTGRPRAVRGRLERTRTPARLRMSPDDEAQRLREKANQLRIEAEKARLSVGVKKIDELEKELRDLKSNEEDAGRLEVLKGRVEDLVRKSVTADVADEMLGSLAAFSSSPDSDAQPVAASPGQGKVLSEEEMKTALALVETLPVPVKDTLARSVGYPSFDSIIQLEEFIENLNSKQDTTAERLRKLYYEAFARNLPGGVEGGQDDAEEIIGMLATAMEESSTGRAMELFPRQVQENEEGIPTEDDAQVVFQVLAEGSTCFSASEKPQKVGGGYIIKGTYKETSNSSDLIDAIDGKIGKISQTWKNKFQVSLVEIYSDDDTQLFQDALFISPNKFPVMAPKALSVAVTAIALFSSVVYCIDCFAENTVVMERLKDAAQIGQNGGGQVDLSWFNELLIPMLLVLGAAQALHEAAHYTMAWTKQVKLSAPTILPSQALPYLSFQNRLKTSPRDYASLFDIAFVGPFVGLTFSFLALYYGLQLTLTVDSSTAQLFPSLPVGFLTQSALGGTLVDTVLGGGDGIILNQDPTTQVPLHPVAVAGFLGMIVHALDLVPVGSTDGGRMSQAVLGRVWHLTFSSIVFFSILVATFTTDSDSLLGFLFIYSFTQRDLEVPCRNEIEKADLPRALTAFICWVLAALIIVPIR
mmetsp:Transcript_26881/g.60783  ORF Transcript_26881/g.60783 Transcript_26881/m.60783 type:complete len:682 (-) Transcript_26881:97-2142(-)